MQDKTAGPIGLGQYAVHLLSLTSFHIFGHKIVLILISSVAVSLYYLYHVAPMQGGVFGVVEVGGGKYKGSVCANPDEAKQSAANIACMNHFHVSVWMQYTGLPLEI